MTTLIVLGLVNWLATTIVVESELFRPLRAWVDIRHARWVLPDGRRARRHKAAWLKLRYLLACHLCAGTWIGFLEAALVPSVRPAGGGFVGWAIAGLAIKAIGHITLEVTALMKRVAA